MRTFKNINTVVKTGIVVVREGLDAFNNTIEYGVDNSKLLELSSKDRLIDVLKGEGGSNQYFHEVLMETFTESSNTTKRRRRAK
jgi:hypothetical protein